MNDEIYRERAFLVAHIASIYPSVIKEATSEDWAIVYIDLPSGEQISWHISENDMDLFTNVNRGHPEWDGHDTEEKYNRLHRATVSAYNRIDY